jgi:lipid-binding SYLF domain-containing protein
MSARLAQSLHIVGTIAHHIAVSTTSCRDSAIVAAPSKMEGNDMLKRFTTTAAALAITAIASGPVHAASDTEQIVTEAKYTVENMTGNKDFGPLVRDFLKNAEGVLILPQMIKGAVMIGGEGGSGVLLTRDKNGGWSYPAFYTLGGASYGLQIGGSSSQVMLLLMTQGGVDAILEGNPIKLGADLGIAAGPVGVGAEAGVTLESADIISYSLSKGAYIGISLEGTVIEPRESYNKDYYGAEVGTEAIVTGNRYVNHQADGLREALRVNASAPAATN